jgi:hypothetical protein
MACGNVRIEIKLKPRYQVIESNGELVSDSDFSSAGSDFVSSSDWKL